MLACLLLPLGVSAEVGPAVPDTPVAADAAPSFHEQYFTEHTYEGTASCLGSSCHDKEAQDVLATGHWKWEGVATNVVGVEEEVHGKNDFINNFCIAVPTNEGRCAQCHIGYGYTDKSFDFTDPTKIDCLICHDQTGTYKKGLTNGGLPDPSVDLQAVARSMDVNDGVPGRINCIVCHANAGGGDNVKHGDLAMSLISTRRQFDVHMATNGANMTCVACHDVDRTAGGEVASHGIGGMAFHSVDEGTMRECVDCHDDPSAIHRPPEVRQMVDSHPRLACQVCHIPAIARRSSTTTEWYWSEAGDLDRVPVLDEDGRPDYDPKKGEFVWSSNVRPVLRYHNGKWNRVMIGVNDQPQGEPVVLSSPAADRSDPDAKIFPFKNMIGNQVADAENNTVMVPHLFKATETMPFPYWGFYDWPLSLWDAVGYPTGQTFTGEHRFVATEALLAVDHEVAPKQDAFGANGACSDCHGQGQIDWAAIGWEDDPYPGTESDVYLVGITMAKQARLPVGRETRQNISVLGDGTGIEQDVTVVLSADVPDGVVYEIQPEAVISAVAPGAPQTRFQFGANVRCESEGSYRIALTATINAQSNADPTNDTVQAEMQLRCVTGL